MSLRERLSSGERREYPDGEQISRSRLARTLHCSPYAVDRLFRAGNISPETKITPVGDQQFMNVDDFPRLVDALKTSRNGKKRLRSYPEETSGTFVAETVTGVVYTYVPPRPTKKR